jgi:isocitrate dehydrogenase
MNPLGMVDALLCAMDHSAKLTIQRAEGDSMSKGHEVEQAEAILNFTKLLKKAMHNTFRYGQGTRDMAGPTGLTTEAFIDKVAWRLGRYYVAHLAEDVEPADLVIPDIRFRRNCEYIKPIVILYTYM